MRRTNRQEGAQQIDAGAPAVAPHAGKPGKARAAMQPHPYRFRLITGMLAKQQHRALLAGICCGNGIALRARPWLNAAGWRCCGHPADCGSNTALAHALCGAGRLLCCRWANTVINDGGAVLPPGLAGIGFCQQGQRCAVRPA